jgi:hypothetical protein
MIQFVESRASIMKKATAIQHQDPNLRAKLRRRLKDRQRKERETTVTQQYVGSASLDVHHQMQQPSLLGRLYV